jgi:hypothetical protein
MAGMMDPFAMFDPLYFDVGGMGMGGDVGGWNTGLGTTGGTAGGGRRRAVMPADVVETPVRASARTRTRSGAAAAPQPRVRGAAAVAMTRPRR